MRETSHCLTSCRVTKHLAPAPLSSPDIEHHSVLHMAVGWRAWVMRLRVVQKPQSKDRPD